MVYRIKLEDGTYEFIKGRSGKYGGHVWPTIQGLRRALTKYESGDRHIVLPKRFENAEIEVFSLRKSENILQFIKHEFGITDVRFDDI